jgi:sarcosine oxidase subunit gamma
MAERRSALANLPAEAGGGARVRLSEVRPGAILQIQAWPATLATVEAVITQILRIAEPPRPGRTVWFHGGWICAIGAGKYLVSTTADDIIATFRTAFSSQDAAVTDISHGRTILRLEGDAAAAVLSCCVPIDFDAGVFPSDSVAQTAIHHVDVLIHRLTLSSFEIWAPRSFAVSLAEWLIDAGTELGVAFRS